MLSIVLFFLTRLLQEPYYFHVFHFSDLPIPLRDSILSDFSCLLFFLSNLSALLFRRV